MDLRISFGMTIWYLGDKSPVVIRDAFILRLNFIQRNIFALTKRFGNAFPRFDRWAYEVDLRRAKIHEIRAQGAMPFLGRALPGDAQEGGVKGLAWEDELLA